MKGTAYYYIICLCMIPILQNFIVRFAHFIKFLNAMAKSLLKYIHQNIMHELRIIFPVNVVMKSDIQQSNISIINNVA